MAVPTISIAMMPANAVDTQQTYAFIVTNPNPAGVGQQVYVFMFLSNLQASAGGTGGARFHGFTCTITKPDGTTETKGPYTADPVSSSYFIYTPQTIGNYKLVMNYPGEETPLTVGPGGTSPDTIFSASHSATITLSVQQNPLPILSGNPTQQGYWTRPINGQNWLWGEVSNNWLMPAWDSTNRQFDQGSAIVPYGSAPDSAHVLWTKPLTFGGIVGGDYVPSNMQFGDGRSYEQFFKPPVIISGRLYYNTIGAGEPVTQINYASIVCVDMKDGSTIFTIPNATLSFAQIYNFVSPNQAGGLAYLWETRSLAGVPTTWRMFDAWTGQYMLSIQNVPSGTVLLDNTFYGQSKQGPGDVLVYNVGFTGLLTIWNSSKTIPTLANFVNGTSIGTNAWQWRPVNVLGSVLNAVGNSTFFMYSFNNYTTTANAAGNAAVPGSNFTSISTDGRQLVTQLQDFPIGGSVVQVGYDNELIVANNSALAGTIFAQGNVRTFVGYDQTTGAKIWGPTTIDFASKVPPNATLYVSTVIGYAQRQIASGDILPIWCKEVGSFYCWNVRTGQFLWGPTPSATDNNGFALYNWECKMVTPAGIVYNWGFDGELHAYNLTTGAALWTFSTGNAGLNTPYGTWPIYNGMTLMDNKLYLQTSDHGNGVEPLYQGEGLYCLDPISGQQLWNMTGWWEQAAISDGRYVTHNCYDNQIYCIAKGPSSTSVEVTPSIQNHGSLVMIQGTVSDVSSGAKQLVTDGKFNLVPLISDADQGRFMNYLYQQQQKPTDAKGVLVHLTVVQPDGSSKDLGYVTSDINGHYAITWTPDQIGTYTVTAAFEGSNSYYPSSDVTSIGMQNAPAAVVVPTATPQPTAVVTPTVAPPTVAPTPTPVVTVAPTPPASPTPVALYVGIAAVVVIIVVVAAALALRRRK
jgi:hypothetical protein